MRTMILTALMLAGCTSYSAGVESNWAQPNVLHVSGDGNKYTTDGRIKDYVFLKAAEKALDAGYAFFVVTQNNNTGRHRTNIINLPYTTDVSVHTYGANTGYNQTGVTYATATTTGGPIAVNNYYPGRDAFFLMFDTKPLGYRPGQYFDVIQVYNDLGPKYLSDFQSISIEQLSEFEEQLPKFTDATTPLRAVMPTAINNPSSVSISKPKTSAPKKENTLNEIYESLSEDEKFIADSMSPSDRVNYIYVRR